MEIFAIVFLLVYLFAIGFSILCYVLQSLGMYTIAKRRGINNPWLAWIPGGSSWMLGCISDQYQYVAKGQVKSKRKILLSMYIVNLVLALVFFAVFIGLMVADVSYDYPENTPVYEEYVYDDYIYGDDYYGDYYDNYDDYYDDFYDDYSYETESEEVALILVFFAVYVAIMIVGIVTVVFQFMAMYDLYRSCDPNSGALFLVLSILLSISPFLIFACRNKDLGMPPRRDPMMPQPTWQPYQPNQWQPPVQPAQPPVWQPPQPPREPWENNPEE